MYQIFDCLDWLFGYLKSSEAPSAPSHFNTTNQALIQKTIVHNHQDSRQCGNAKQSPKTADFSQDSNTKRDSYTRNEILGGCVALAVTAVVGQQVYTRYCRPDASGDRATTGSSEKTDGTTPSGNTDSAVPSGITDDTVPSDPNASERNTQDADGNEQTEDILAGEESDSGCSMHTFHVHEHHASKQRTANGNQPDDGLESDSGRSVHTLHVYEQHTSVRRTAKGRNFMTQATRVTRSETVTTRGSRQAKVPKPASSASRHDAASQQSEQRDWALRIQKRLLASGQQPAGGRSDDKHPLS